LGKFCWQLKITENEHGPKDQTFTVQAGVTHVGDNYYTLQGILDIPSDIGNTVILQGSAVVKGADVLMIVNTSQDNRSSDYDETLYGGTGQARLSKSTLNGEFMGIDGGFYFPGEVGEIGYTLGTMTFVSCP
jgi:hypothetical protein